MTATIANLHNADDMAVHTVGFSAGTLLLPRPKSGWMWLAASGVAADAMLSTGSSAIEAHRSRFTDNSKTLSIWICKAPDAPLLLTAIGDELSIDCYFGTLPAPLDSLASRSQGEVAALAQMLGVICSHAPLDRADLRDLTTVQSFDLLRGCAAVARCLGFFETEAGIIEAALSISRSPNLLRLLSYAHAHAHNYPAAIMAAEKALHAKPDLAGGPFTDHLAELGAYCRIAEELRSPPPERTTANSSPTIAYCLHNALPYAQGGYAMRSHAVAQALAVQGQDIRVFARPGFPSDGEAAHGALGDSEIIDGVCYHFENGFGRRGRAYGYIAEAADYFEQAFVDHAIGLVHAATNFWTALPAAMAARRLGLPFVYEVRSFWSITREAREPGFRKTAQARRDDALETIALAMADQVLTLNGAMRRELAEMGVEEDRTDLAPNGVDGQRFAPGPCDPALAHQFGVKSGDIVIGYMGAMLGYEGIDLLVEAIAPIIREDDRVRLVIVGADPGSRMREGSIEHRLAEQIQQLGMGERITLADRAPPGVAADIYRLFDICAYPRRAFEVCELVSPLKPLEAMAAGKTVIVSDVHALAEMIADGETGLLFAKEDPKALRSALVRSIADTGLRDRLGAAARSFVQSERNWTGIAAAIGRAYDRACSGSTSRPSGLAARVAAHFPVPEHDPSIFSISGQAG